VTKPDYKYYVYTLLSLRNFDFYTGLTTNLKQRILDHAKGLVDSTKIRIPFKLIHYEYFVNLEDAKERERFLKTNTGKAQLKQALKKTLQERRSFPYRLHR